MKTTTKWGWIVAVTTGLWFAAVIAGSISGFFSSLYMPSIAALVATGITLPTLAYFTIGGFKQFISETGVHRLSALHVWRIPAAILFFAYGLSGALPPVFWILAGTGDLLAGLFAVYVSLRPRSRDVYLAFHLFGFADFVVAVGTGLTHTILLDPRMAPIAVLPMSLIPLFGVGISGATHLMAFDLLGKKQAQQPSLQPNV